MKSYFNYIAYAPKVKTHVKYLEKKTKICKIKNTLNEIDNKLDIAGDKVML